MQIKRTGFWYVSVKRKTLHIYMELNFYTLCYYNGDGEKTGKGKSRERRKKKKKIRKMGYRYFRSLLGH
jgi:hypothetical protein